MNQPQPPSDVIAMADMRAIFNVTDAFGLDREAVSVALEKSDPGAITRAANGTLEITVPLSQSLDAFVERLRAELSAMGYEEKEVQEE